MFQLLRKGSQQLIPTQFGSGTSLNANHALRLTAEQQSLRSNIGASSSSSSFLLSTIVHQRSLFSSFTVAHTKLQPSYMRTLCFPSSAVRRRLCVEKKPEQNIINQNGSNNAAQEPNIPEAFRILNEKQQAVGSKPTSSRPSVPNSSQPAKTGSTFGDQIPTTNSSASSSNTASVVPSKKKRSLLRTIFGATFFFSSLFAAYSEFFGKRSRPQNPLESYLTETHQFPFVQIARRNYHTQKKSILAAIEDISKEKKVVDIPSSTAIPPQTQAVVAASVPELAPVAKQVEIKVDQATEEVPDRVETEDSVKDIPEPPSEIQTPDELQQPEGTPTDSQGKPTFEETGSSFSNDEPTEPSPNQPETESSQTPEQQKALKTHITPETPTESEQKEEEAEKVERLQQTHGEPQSLETILQSELHAPLMSSSPLAEATNNGDDLHRHPDYQRFQELLQLQEKLHQTQLVSQHKQLNALCQERMGQVIQKVQLHQQELAARASSELLLQHEQNLRDTFELEKKQLELQLQEQFLNKEQKMAKTVSTLAQQLEADEQTFDAMTNALASHRQLFRLTLTLMQFETQFSRRHDLTADFARLRTAAGVLHDSAINEAFEKLDKNVLASGVESLEQLKNAMPVMIRKARLSRVVNGSSDAPSGSTSSATSASEGQSEGESGSSSSLGALFSTARRLVQTNLTQGLDAGDSFARAEFYLMERNDLENALNEIKRDPQFESLQTWTREKSAAKSPSGLEDFTKWVEEAENRVAVARVFNLVQNKTLDRLRKEL